MSNEYALDAIIHFNVHSLKQLQGGFVSYVARDADEEVSCLSDPDVLMCIHKANVCAWISYVVFEIFFKYVLTKQSGMWYAVI